MCNSATSLKERATPRSGKKKKQICISLRSADFFATLKNAATLDRGMNTFFTQFAKNKILCYDAC